MNKLLDFSFKYLFPLRIIILGLFVFVAIAEYILDLFVSAWDDGKR